MTVFCRSQVPFYLAKTLALEIFAYKLPVVHLEVVLHILQCRVIVANHQVGIFAHDMHLLNLLFVELVKHPVVILLVALFAVLQPFDIHSIIEHKEPAFQFQRINLLQVQQRLFYFWQPYITESTKQRLLTALQLVQQFDDRELYGSSFAGVRLHQAIEPLHSVTADFDTLLKSSYRGIYIVMKQDFYIVSRIFLLADIAFHGQEIQQRANVFFFRRWDAGIHGLVVQLLAGCSQDAVFHVLQYEAFEFHKPLQQ